MPVILPPKIILPVRASTFTTLNDISTHYNIFDNDEHAKIYEQDILDIFNGNVKQYMMFLKCTIKNK